MKVRWKLHCSVIALVAIFLVAAGFSLRAVRGHGDHMRAQSRMRAQSQQTADIRAAVYQHLAAREGLIELPPGLDDAPWPGIVLDDIQVQIRLASEVRESGFWITLNQSVVGLAELEARGGAREAINAQVQQIEHDLRHLRNFYDTQQSVLAASGARAGYFEYVLLVLASGLTVLIFLVYLLMARDWLVKPIEVLRRSVSIIGRGELQHRVPLNGQDELSELARGIEGMADELAQRQEALAEAREMSAVGELCGNVAHGLRNPLASIRANAQLAERRLRGEEEVEALMKAVTEQADRMDQRISRLFDYSRTVQMQRASIPFMVLAEAALDRVLPLLRAQGISSRIVDRTEGVALHVDRDQIIEVLAELISNAAHHSSAEGAVEVVGRLLDPVNGCGPTVLIEVRDKGKGMDESTARKAFDPFFTSRPSGIGMGLALVRRVVERHSGRVDLSSELGVGTSVRLQLPGTSSATA